MLTRKTPMNRGSGFKRPEREEKPKVCAILRPIRQIVPKAQAAKLPVCQPKFEYVRSPPLLRACGLLPCQHCGSMTGSVAAHSNWAIHGKGRSIKASDVYVSALCHTCHSELDQGKIWTDAEKKSIWWQSHARTIQALVTRNLWPLGIQVPSLEWPKEWHDAQTD